MKKLSIFLLLLVIGYTSLAQIPTKITPLGRKNDVVEIQNKLRILGTKNNNAEDSSLIVDKDGNVKQKKFTSGGGGGAGTVTQINLGYGILGGNITSTGTAKIDTSEIVNFNALNSSLLNKWGLSGNNGTNPAISYLGSGDTTLSIKSFGRKTLYLEKWKNTEYNDTLLIKQKIVATFITYLLYSGSTLQTNAFGWYQEGYVDGASIEDAFVLGGSNTTFSLYRAYTPTPSLSYVTLEGRKPLVRLDTSYIYLGPTTVNGNWTIKIVLNTGVYPNENFPSKKLILHDNFLNTDTEYNNLSNGDTLTYNYTTTSSGASKGVRFVFYYFPKGPKMGVGTDTASSTLHVVGDVRIVDGTQGDGKIFTSDANGKGSWQSANGIGEITTASNLGGGLANYSSKSGSDLKFNSFKATDFTLTSNLISVNYTGGQTANTSTKGFLSATDWNTFNNKGSVNSVAAGYGMLGGTITNTGTHSVDTTSINGLVSKDRLNHAKDSLISVISSLGGEVNTASNIGSGLSIYDSKSGADLRFNSFLANDFNLASNLLSIDYTNGQAATSSVKGFLTATDWTTFNNKGTVNSVAAGYGILGGTITNTGTHSADTASINGIVSKDRLNHAKDSLITLITTSAGEINTGSNLGGGLANYSTKVGNDLRFNSFAAADFNLASNLITIDYTNGQTASTSTKGFLSATDWNTFNSKGDGTVTGTSIVTANGFAGTISNSSTTPAITISTTITGLLKGNGSAVSAATLGTDYGSVATGGTGRTSHTTYALLAGGTTSTNPLQQVASGTVGQVLTYVSPSALPTWQTPASPGEVNTASSVGGGLTIYDSKSGSDIRLNSLLASDFNLASNLISIDYANGQTANGSTKGFLSATDWTTFNNKGNGSVTSVAAGYGLLGGTITNTGTHSVDTTSINGLVSKDRLNHAKDSLIALMTAGSGEINTGSNLGGGLANYSTKVGFDLRFNTFEPTDFNLSSNLITIDYANGQSASTSTKGFLSATDWNTFNSKGNGTVTGTSVVTANGFAGTISNSSTTPAITVNTTVTGILKGNGSAISAAVLGTDYGSVATGGTGRTTHTAYAILAGGTTSTNPLQPIASGTAGQVLTYVSPSALPTWQTPTPGEVNTASSLGGGLSVYDSKSAADIRFNSFAAADFNLASNLITIDYTNGQTANTSTKGFLSATDWNTFNNKGNGSVTSVVAGYGILGGTITNTGTHSVDTTSINGLVSKDRLNHAKDSLIALIASGGEANTAANLGGGLANYDSKSGVSLRFNSYAAADFNLASNLITIDYANGQTANGSTKGFLSATDWNTFNNKGTVNSVAAGYGILGGTITNTGTHSVDTTSSTGIVSKTRLTNSLNSILAIIANADTLHTDSSYAYIDYNVSTGAQTFAINIANTGDSGIISKEDWNLFNNKENVLTFSTGLNRSGNSIVNTLTTGIAGGQTINGGTSAANNITISSTTNGTKGKIIFGTSSAYDQANDRIGISQLTPLSKLHISTASIGTTQTDATGILLNNPTAATVGSQQISPAIVWQGNGWKTTATAASQEVRFRADVLPVQGSTSPSGIWQLSRSVNGGAYANVMTVDASGNTVTAGNSISTLNTSAGGQINTDVTGVTATYRTTNAGSDITPGISVWNGVVTAGTHGVAIDQTNDIMLSASNGTRQVARGGVRIKNLVNTLGSESGDVAIATQAAGAAMTDKMVISSQGVVTITGMTAAAAAAISPTPTDGSYIYVTTTNGTFTSVGFWGRENGVWIKL